MISKPTGARRPGGIRALRGFSGSDVLVVSSLCPVFNMIVIFILTSTPPPRLRARGRPLLPREGHGRGDLFIFF